MKNIIYKVSLKFFLTADMTKRIESRISILYPSTKYSIINRTAEYLMRIYMIVLLLLVALFGFADFSVYYMMISFIVIYAVINSKIYNDLDMLEIKLLMQLEKFVSDVKFRFQFDGMLEEAIQDAINLAEYEMSIQGERILECLKNHYRKDSEEYGETAPDNYFLTFYSICSMALKYGDKKIEDQSMFVKNLGYLKEDINIEQLKRRKINNLFMGLFGLTLIPVFSIKPIERWALSNMPEMAHAYYSLSGIFTTMAIAGFTVCVYKIINMLKRVNHKENYKNTLIERLAEKETLRKEVFEWIKLRKKSSERINRLLKEVVYPYDLVEFTIDRFIHAFLYSGVSLIITVSIGLKLYWICLAVIVGFAAGYAGKYIGIVIKKQILIMEREDEIVRFQTLILMVMHIDRMTIAEILQIIERFALIFKNEVYDLSNTISYKGMDTFREAKGKLGFEPYEKLLDGFIACDTMPIYKAFEDTESDRKYYVEKHKQDNEEIINRKAMIAKTLAFTPLCIVILGKLIIPFVVEGISGLGNTGL